MKSWNLYLFISYSFVCWRAKILKIRKIISVITIIFGFQRNTKLEEKREFYTLCSIEFPKMLIPFSNKSFRALLVFLVILTVLEIYIFFCIGWKIQKKEEIAFESMATGCHRFSFFPFFGKNHFNRNKFIVETVLSKGNLFIALWPVNNKRWRH